MSESSDHIQSRENPPKAPKRPPKHASLNHDPDLIQADDLIPGSSSTQCMVCGKDLDHLDEKRRMIHINTCLDSQEAQSTLEKEQKKWEATFDCPMCGEPLGPGPYRTAHAKKCAKKHDISASNLFSLMETQAKVAKERKKLGINHTSAKDPILPTKKRTKKAKEVPKSRFDEQIKLGLAHSESIAPPTDAAKPSTSKGSGNGRRFFPHPINHQNNASVPAECKCHVIEAMQKRFAHIFKLRQPKLDDLNDECDSRKCLTTTTVEKAFKKLTRYERFADDFQKYCARTQGDVILEAKDGYVRVHSFILAVRTTIHPDPITKTAHLDVDRSTLLPYVHFLNSASIEWTTDQIPGLIELATKYGPSDLLTSIESQKPVQDLEEIQEIHDVHSISERETGASILTNRQNRAETELELSEPKSTENFKSFDEPPRETEDIQEIGMKTHRDTYEVVNDTYAIEKVNENCTVDKCNAETSRPRDSFFDSQYDHIFSENLSPEQFIKPATPIQIQEEKEKSIDFGNESDDSVVIIEDSMAQEASVVPESPPEEIAQHPIRRSLSFLTRPRESSSQKNSMESPSKSPSAKKSRISSYHALPQEPGHSMFFDDEITRRVQEMAEKLKRREIEGPKPPPTYCDDPSFLLSQGFIAPQPSRPQPRISDSFYRDDSCLFNPIVEDLAQDSPEKHISPRQTPVKLYGPSAVVQPHQKPGASDSASTPPTRLYQPAPQIATAVKIKQKLGSAVKLLKTTDITPMPDYKGMTNEELKQELLKYGFRPMGRKKAIETLDKIYETTHPVVDLDTPTTSRASTIKASDKPALAPRRLSKEFIENGYDDLLNRTLNENVEESCLFSDHDDENSRSPTKPQKLPKDLDKLQKMFVEWIRLSENDPLYQKVLQLRPVSLEELTDALSKSEHIIRKIPKRTLIDILDRLHVTFTLPQDGWHRRKQKKSPRKNIKKK